MNVEDLMGIFVVVLLALMVLALLILAVSMLMDSIGDWKDRKRGRR